MKLNKQKVAKELLEIAEMLSDAQIITAALNYKDYLDSLDNPKNSKFKNEQQYNKSMGVGGEGESGKKEVPKGLKNWVKDYQTTRETGNIADAKKLKNNIDKQIKELGLDAKDVYGEDPRKKFPKILPIK